MPLLMEPSLWHDGVVEALKAGDTPRAIALARQALDAGVETALFLNLRAHAFDQDGKPSQALADLRRARQLAPADVPVLNALALALARDGAFDEAAGVLDEALAHAPDFPPLHFNRGWVCEELGELDDARRNFARAAELAPADPNPPARLAALALRLGDAAEARRRAERALAIDPRHPGAGVALAGIDIRERRLESAAEILERFLALPDLPPFERAQALNLKGELSDARGQAGTAFAAYRAGNDLLRAMNAARFARPAGDTMPEYLAKLRHYFARAPSFSPSPPAADANASGHVFLVGFPRSGTTLLEEALASHPAVVTTQERDGLADGVRDLMTAPQGLDRLAGLSDADARRYRRLYWARLDAHGIACEGRMVVDKQPYNTINLPLIVRLFPSAHIVFSLRDPRDVVLSCFRRMFRINAGNWELLTLEGAAGLYDAVMRLADLYRAKLPLALHELRFEALVRDPKAELETLCRVIGLPWDDAMLRMTDRAQRRAIVTPSAAQLARGLNQDGVGTWRRYAQEMAPVLPVLAPWLLRLSYGDT